MTAKIWDAAFDLLMINEGDYVNDQNDKGGETKYGISKKSYPEIDIANLTLEQAKRIYYEDYWKRIKGDYLPDAVSVAVFDYAVNSGIYRAVKDLQSCLGIKSDGIIGNQTLGACNTQPAKKFLPIYFQRRRNFLMSLKDWSRYGSGWGKRVNRVEKYCEEIC